MADREYDTRTILRRIGSAKTPRARADAVERCFALWQNLIGATVRRIGAGASHDELEDLTGAARLGLIQAIEGYQVGFGTRFETYAIGKIRASVWACAHEMHKPRQWCSDWSEFAELDDAQTTLVGSRCDGAPYEMVEKQSRHDALRRAVGRLETRDRALLSLRYGARSTVALTAKAMGISPTRVSQLETRVLARLKGTMDTDNACL